MSRHRHAPCPDCQELGCEACVRPTDPDIEWLALHHGMSYAALTEQLGDADASEVCTACLVWLTGNERTVCNWCRN